MEKVIENGNVAVLVSHGFGAGWYTWNSSHPELLFHPKLVEMVMKGKRNEIDEQWVLENLGIANVYCGGAEDLEIHWIPQGTGFHIEDYDGNESLITSDILLIA